MKNNNTYFAIVLILSVITLQTNGEYYSTTKTAKLPVLKKTSLHFYLHDAVSGENPDVVLVAQPNITLGKPSATPFGSVYASENRLTLGPETNFTDIGNAQGLYLSSSKNTFSLMTYADFEFTTGKFNGSSLSIFSKNPMFTENIELDVVGGRGKFKMAKGTAYLKTYFLDKKTGDNVIEYHVEVYHY